MFFLVQLYSPHSHHYTIIPRILTLIPRIPIPIPCIPTLIRHIPTPLSAFPAFPPTFPAFPTKSHTFPPLFPAFPPHSPHSPHSVPRFPIPTFADSRTQKYSYKWVIRKKLSIGLYKSLSSISCYSSWTLLLLPMGQMNRLYSMILFIMESVIWFGKKSVQVG